MNAPITRLFGLFLLLFALLVAFTSRWTVFEAEALRDEPSNRRALLQEQRIRRGTIFAADRRTVLARSVRGEARTYRRTYPQGGLFGHAIGYSFTNLGRSGLEQSYNDELTGRDDEIASILDELRGKSQEGDDLITTLDPDGQRAALQALSQAPTLAGTKAGSVVAIEPATGRVRVMASLPGFDPNEVPDRFRRLSSQEGSPLLNRATQAGYPPGSTFKVVTAASALDSGRFTPDTTVSGRSPLEVSGVPLTNFENQDFGQVTLTTALTKSINTVWAQVGLRLGKEAMGRDMERFGFYSKPPLDYPGRQRTSSGEYRGADLLDPESRFIDLGRMAIGQDKLRVTPLQMAMVAAAVANDGELMRPHLVDRVVDRDGRTVEEVEPEVESRVMKAGAARRLGAMMSQVVREGTGTASALQGIEVAGKTGTAEIDVQRNVNQPWFIAFAPVDRPRIAVAVTVERSSGQGGTVAAPIAKRVMEALLR